MKIYSAGFLVTATIIGLYALTLSRLYWYIGQEIGRTIGGL